MSTRDKAELLSQFLGKLPEAAAKRLAKAIEMDRLAGGTNLPHELILAGLRPVLRRAKGVERTPTPLRLFCEPFQDLLTLVPRKTKQAGRIATSSITPVWAWLSLTLIPDEAALYVDRVKHDILGAQYDSARGRAQEFWAAAAKVMLDALSGPERLKACRQALGDELVVADAREMALMLSVGTQLSEIQNILPKPTPIFTEDALWSMRKIYDAVVESAADAAPYVSVVVMNRLERPWEAMRLPLSVSRQTQDTLISSTDMGLVGEILFTEIEAHAVAIRSVRQPQFDPDELIAHVASFATLSAGMVKEVEIRRDGRWGQRLLKDRAAMAEVMDGFMKRAPREILGAFPTLKTGSYSGGPRIPDVSRALDPEKTARAMNYAKLVSGCKPFAPAASFGASLADVQDEVASALKIYSEDLLRELRAAEGEKRAHAEGFFALAAELTSVFLSADEAEFLRRRGRAALGTQAAA